MIRLSNSVIDTQEFAVFQKSST